jgi:hypothetical protein
VAVRHEDLDAREAIVYAFPGAPGQAALWRRARMLRRRRRTLASLGVILVLVGTLIEGRAGPAPVSRPGAPRAVVLPPGGSLWEVAERFAPRRTDVRAYVDALLELNGGDAPPRTGSRIVLPR